MASESRHNVTTSMNFIVCWIIYAQNLKKEKNKGASKNNFPLPVKGSRGDKSIEVVATGSLSMQYRNKRWLVPARPQSALSAFRFL